MTFITSLFQTLQSAHLAASLAHPPEAELYSPGRKDFWVVLYVSNCESKFKPSDGKKRPLGRPDLACRLARLLDVSLWGQRWNICSSSASSLLITSLSEESSCSDEHAADYKVNYSKKGARWEKAVELFKLSSINAEALETTSVHFKTFRATKSFCWQLRLLSDRLLFDVLNNPLNPSARECTSSHLAICNTKG